jgi:hypothetical protein
MSSQIVQPQAMRKQQVEARTSVRYRFGLPARFWWNGQAGRRLQGEGFTQDISVCGAYILTSTFPPLDLTVQLEILLTSPDGTGHLVTLASQGRVLRIQHPADGKTPGGFAVVGKGFEILVVEIAQT